MKKILVLIALLLTTVGLQAKVKKENTVKRKAASENSHKCEQDALDRSIKLIRLHVLGSSEKTSEYVRVDEQAFVPEASIDAAATGVDIIMVNGYDGNAQYSMNFSYLSSAKNCQLVKFELIDSKR